MNRIFTAAILAILAVTATFRKDESAEKNKAIVRRVFIDIWTRGRCEVAQEIYAKDSVNRGADKDIGFEADQADIHGWTEHSQLLLLRQLGLYPGRQ